MLYKGFKTKIILGPDGSKPYSENRLLAPRWVIRRMVLFFKFTNIIFGWPWVHFHSLKYGNLNSIDEILLQFPESFKVKTKKIVSPIELFINERERYLLGKIYNINYLNILGRTNKLVLYLNQPLVSKDLIESECDLIKKIIYKFPEYKLIIKAHPLSSKIHLEKLKSIENSNLIFESIPAELLILGINDSIILSIDSAACLMNNVDCRIYWLLKYFINIGHKPDYLTTKNPTKHIIEVKELDQII